MRIRAGQFASRGSLLFIIITAITSASLFSAIVSVATNAALPPGYEDDLWCPPDTCQIYTNPYGYVGATSSFNLCYNPDTDEITKGVWTGSKTDVRS